jgi:enoyl-CoA hydratase/carnithine racemase
LNSKVLVERKKFGAAEDAVTMLELNRPEESNAIDSEMLASMISSLTQVNSSESSRLLVVKGRGRDFCIGRDAKESPMTPSSFNNTLRSITALNKLLRTSKCITISSVRGKAFGMGFGIALQTDFTIAADDASFSFPEMKTNLPPAVVLSYINSWLPMKTAFELVVTSREVDAKEAKELRLVNSVVPGKLLDAECESLVGALLKKDAASLRLCKSFAVETRGMNPDESANYGMLSLFKWLSERTKT